ncbi:MAG: hypothetical protein ABIQ30_12215 [Devosia sp.]
MLKVVLKFGTAAIEVEGDKQSVDDVLTKFWVPLTLPGGTFTGKQAPPESSAALRKTRRPTQAKDKPTQGVSVSEMDIANTIKSHERFGVFNKKIILVRAEWIRKCQMVILAAGVPVHSGTISRVATALGIKNTLPTISRTLSANKAQFLTTGTNPETYNFTASSRAEFDKWLNNADDKN